MHRNDLSSRVRDRIRTEKDRLKLSERDIAGMLQWSQSRVSQKLSGRTPWTLEELEALCFAVSLPVTEVVRDHGLEFCAEMTPTELRLVERVRQLTPDQRDGILTVLNVAKNDKKQAIRRRG